MDKKLKGYVEKILSDLFISKNYLSLYERLSEFRENNTGVYNDFKDFWDFSYNSFLYSGTIILAKVYDKKAYDKRDKDSITLYKILNCFKTNKPNENIKKMIKTFEIELDKNEQRIESLRCQRDKFYAHNDKISVEKLLEIAYLTHGDKLELLELGKRICQYFFAQLSDEKSIPHLLWDRTPIISFDSILNCLKEHKEIYSDMAND